MAILNKSFQQHITTGMNQFPPFRQSTGHLHVRTWYIHVLMRDERRKKERSKQRETNKQASKGKQTNKAKQHSTPKANFS